MRITLLLVLAWVGTQPVSADFPQAWASRAVHLSIELDGDPSTHPPVDAFGTPNGVFDPVEQSMSEFGTEQGSASCSFDHWSDVATSLTSLAVSMTDVGFGSSNPGFGHRGTLNAHSQIHLDFASDTPFSLTLTASFSHSGGTPGNVFNPGLYGVRLANATTGAVLVEYDLARPSGSATMTAPPGSYQLFGLSGMGFDAVFGNPPASSFSSSFNSAWSFSATAIGPEPVLAISLINPEHVRITWPTNATDYVLQSTDRLPATAWSPIPGTPAIIGDQFVLPVEIAQGPKFFRLHRP